MSSATCLRGSRRHSLPRPRTNMRAWLDYVKSVRAHRSTRISNIQTLRKFTLRCSRLVFGSTLLGQRKHPLDSDPQAQTATRSDGHMLQRLRVSTAACCPKPETGTSPSEKQSCFRVRITVSISRGGGPAVSRTRSGCARPGRARSGLARRTKSTTFMAGVLT